MEPVLWSKELTICGVYLVATRLSASLPSSFSPHHPPLWVGLSPPTREKFSSLSENKFETSCWAISEGKGTGGTVLSNNICAIHSAWDGRGGIDQAPTREDGENGGWNHGDGCSLLSDRFHYSKRQSRADHWSMSRFFSLEFIKDQWFHLF